MAYKNYYLRLRIKSVQKFDSLYYEKGNNAKSHKRIWKRMGKFIYGISYDTYLAYLQADVSDLPELTPEAVEALRRLAEETPEEENPRVARKRSEKIRR